MKRIFDLVFSFIGLILIFPFLLIIALVIKLTSKGSVFYTQLRVGKDNMDFRIYKFRTMYNNSDKLGLLTIGNRDTRITKIGYFLRKYKLDELPQLFNVILGNMSFVGPRPEVRKYVNLYNQHQKQVLNLKPGITDLASIKFSDESEQLLNQKDADSYYINKIMPNKIEINLNYNKQRNLIKDIQVIFKTLLKCKNLV